MTTALTLAQYLNRNGIAYTVVPHAPTKTSLCTAQAAHVPPDKLAKAVILKRSGGYLLAVVPASHSVQWKALEDCLHEDVTLATEEEIAWLFPDCDTGAVPALGEPYGIETVLDDRVAEQPDIYLEGGDHTTLIHMSGAAFGTVMAHAKHGRFSTHH